MAAATKPVGNKSGRKAGAEMINSRPEKLRLREVQLRTRWTSTEKSVKFKNACSRFVASSMSQLAGPFNTMRDLFAGTLDEQSEHVTSGTVGAHRAAPLQRPGMDRHSSFSQSHYPRTYDKLEATGTSSGETQKPRRLSMMDWDERELYEIFDAHEEEATVDSKQNFEGVLKVYVKSIEGFSNFAGFMDKCDPFVEITLGNQTFKTKTKENAGGTIEFDQTLVFDKRARENFLSVKVMDSDTLIHDTIGTLKVNLLLQNLHGSGAHKKAIAFDATKAGEVTGKVYLSFEA
jgi:hypothetical protein